MTHADTNPEGDPSVLSRRRALQVGVGVGVGAVAWSGATITSLGGTPAFASGCTFVIDIDLSAGCRNTTQLAGSDFGYQPLSTAALPSGFSIGNNVPNNTPCEAEWVSQFNFPAGLTCVVRIQFNAPPNCSGAGRGTLTFGPGSDGQLDIVFACVEPTFPSNTQHTITATCNTTGAPAECLN